MSTSPQRKRSRKSPQPDDDESGKKHRGRPRVDTQDETAADRRRTQIRLAQRAYRSRKEATITSLNKRVSELEHVIEEMATTFLRFNDKASKRTVFQSNPDLASELHKTVQRFIELAPTSANDDDLPIEADMSQPQSETASLDAVENAGSYQRLSHSRGSNPPPGEVAGKLPWGSFRSMDEIEVMAEQILGQRAHNAPTLDPGQYSNTSVLPFGLVDPHFEEPTRLITSDNMPDNPPMAEFNKLSLTPYDSNAPYVYSFQESSFYRRVQRAALETGFHILTRYEEYSDQYRYAFRLCLLYSTRDFMLAKFRNLLRVDTKSPLAYFQSPFLHLGGAGLHYRHRKALGAAEADLDRRGNKFRLDQADPTNPNIVRLVNLDNPATSPDFLLDITGYEGDWFDPNDLQCYLEEHGIVVEPQASFAEGEVLETCLVTPDAARIADVPEADQNASLMAYNDGVSSIGATSSSAGQSPEQQNGPATPSTVHDVNIGNYNNVQSLESFLEGLSSAPDGNLSFGSGAFDFVPFETPKDLNTADFGGFEMPHANCKWHRHGATSNGAGKKVRITVDVGKMIDELMMHAVCLGRAPGFRRTNVDRALAAATIHVQR